MLTPSDDNNNDNSILEELNVSTNSSKIHSQVQLIKYLFVSMSHMTMHVHIKHHQQNWSTSSIY